MDKYTIIAITVWGAGFVVAAFVGVMIGLFFVRMLSPI